MKKADRIIMAIILFTVIGKTCAKVAGFVDPFMRWERGSTVPVCFENLTSANLAGRQMVEYIVKNSWENIANINFHFQSTPCGSTQQGIMIKITDTEIRSCNGRNTPQPGRPGTCIRSEGGKAKWAKMHLNFTFENFKGAMSPVAVDPVQRRKQINRMMFHYTIHEFGHAIGFLHEDDRVDGKKDAGARDCQDDDGEDLKQNAMAISYYDVHSVMHYLCNQAGNWSNGPPVTLSCGDMIAARSMYGNRNTHISANCIAEKAKESTIPNTSEGFAVPTGSYDLDGASDSYQPIVNPTYTSTANNWSSITHRDSRNWRYIPTVEPKISMSINPEMQSVSGSSRQGYRITITYHPTRPTASGIPSPSQAWVQELTLKTFAGPITVYKDIANPPDNKPAWAYPEAGEFDAGYYCIRVVDGGRNTSLDKKVFMSSSKMDASNRSWSIWVPKGQGAYRDGQDNYGFKYAPPLPAINVMPADEKGLYFADMNFASVTARITYWDFGWYESINIKGMLPQSPRPIQFFFDKREVLSKSVVVPVPQSPKKFLEVGKTEVTFDDYYFVTSNKIPFSKETWNPWNSRKPVGQVTWYDAIIYCNLRSEMEGLEKVYSYTDPVYGADNSQWKGRCIRLSNLSADLNKSGYRLPTEEEWMSLYAPPYLGEYYWPSGQDPAEYAWYGKFWEFNTKSVGLKLPNAKGVHDLSGNAAEFVWASESGHPESSPTIFLKGGSVGLEPPSIGRSSRISRHKDEHDPAHSIRVVRTVHGPLNSAIISRLVNQE